eukprot:3642242-Pyramimonas_sp.AAC.1
MRILNYARRPPPRQRPNKCLLGRSWGRWALLGDLDIILAASRARPIGSDNARRHTSLIPLRFWSGRTSGSAGVT